VIAVSTLGGAVSSRCEVKGRETGEAVPTMHFDVTLQECSSVCDWMGFDQKNHLLPVKCGNHVDRRDSKYE